MNMAQCETFAGDPQKGMRLFEEILEAHSETPHSADIVRFWKSIAAFVLNDPAASKATLKEISGRTYLRNLMLAACHAALGEQSEARIRAAAVLAEVPGLTVSGLGVLRCFRRAEDADKLRAAWRDAGVPE
jgi:hypothetical protein